MIYGAAVPGRSCSFFTTPPPSTTGDRSAPHSTRSMSSITNFLVHSSASSALVFTRTFSNENASPSETSTQPAYLPAITIPPCIHREIPMPRRYPRIGPAIDQYRPVKRNANRRFATCMNRGGTRSANGRFRPPEPLVQRHILCDVDGWKTNDRIGRSNWVCGPSKADA